MEHEWSVLHDCAAGFVKGLCFLAEGSEHSRSYVCFGHYNSLPREGRARSHEAMSPQRGCARFAIGALPVAKPSEGLPSLPLLRVDTQLGGMRDPRSCPTGREGAGTLSPGTLSCYKQQQVQVDKSNSFGSALFLLAPEINKTRVIFDR